MEVQCPSCGESAPAGQVCERCGVSLDRTCTSCTTVNQPSARFCAQCGQAFAAGPALVEAAAQQKQVTILFADICGSTEIVASMDAEDASLALGSVLHVISTAVRRFGGVVNQRMGDGVMVLFGAPVAAEDHAARACFAALAILADVAGMAARALPVRVGVCSGPVILRRTGRDEGDYEVAGVTAHIAARLEQRADPGTILIAPQTLHLVIGIAQTEPVGLVMLKGLAGPLEVHRLVGARDQPSWTVRSSTRTLSPFVNRSTELAQVRAALRRAAGGSSQAVALVGDAGMGKSRLVHEVLDALPPGEWHVIRVETTAQSTAVPYLLLTAMLRQVVGCTPDAALADVAARLPPALAALGFEPAGDLSPLMLHLGQDDAAPDAGAPDAHRVALVRVMAPVLRRYTELHPVILLVEDFHWLDASSADLLDALRSELDGARLLLLLTTRPERRPGWEVPDGVGTGGASADRASADGASTGGVSTGGDACVIELAPLTSAHADAMLGGLVGGGTELAPLRALVTARADGTPFFLEEFAQSLHEQGTLAEGAPQLQDIDIPASVQGILAARIDRLPPLHRHVLQTAAVVGREVPWALLAAVADLPAAALADALAALRAGRFLAALAGPGGAVHSFLHALTQAVAYDTLLRSDRRTLHGRVLRALEAPGSTHAGSSVDDLAHHAACAEAWPEAARYAMAAGEQASRRLAPTEAKLHLKAAIAALGRQPPTPATIAQGIDARLSLRGVLASLTDTAGQDAVMQTILAEADHLAAQTGDRLVTARVYVGRSVMLSHWGDLPGAMKLSRSALADLRAAGEALGTVGAAFSLAQAHWYAGDLDSAQAVLADNIGHARSPAGQQRSSATFVLPAVAFFCYLGRIQAELGHLQDGLAAIAEARSLALAAGQAFDEALVDLNEGAAWMAAGDTDRAVEVLERALGIARLHVIEWHLPSIACLLGAGWIDQGRTTEARELLQEASAYADRNRHVAKRLLCSPPLIRALAAAPHHDLPAARALAKRTLHDAASRGFKPIVRQTHAALAAIGVPPDWPPDQQAATLPR